MCDMTTIKNHAIMYQSASDCIQLPTAGGSAREAFLTCRVTYNSAWSFGIRTGREMVDNIQ